MNKLMKEILDYLVTRYEKATGKQMIHDDTMDSEQGRYHFRELNDNLIEPMLGPAEKQYGEADGKELEVKMRAIRSSSAMTYNLFGNGNSIINENDQSIKSGVYQVEFEKQLKTIKRSPRKANLDAFLSSDEALIFFEMKMTEWIFNDPGNVSVNYLDKGHYFDPDSFETFEKLIKGIVDEKPVDSKDYPSALNRYDGVQMFKHLLGVYNYLMQEDKGKHKHVRLVNCVWELPDSAEISKEAWEQYRKLQKLEEDEFMKFYAAAQPVIELINEKDIDFDILFIPVKDLIAILNKTDEQIAFLNRYL